LRFCLLAFVDPSLKAVLSTLRIFSSRVTPIAQMLMFPSKGLQDIAIGTNLHQRPAPIAAAVFTIAVRQPELAATISYKGLC